MKLKRGDKLGDRFQLLSKLGEGGMGEVWKARDTELDRDRNNSSRAPSNDLDPSVGFCGSDRTDSAGILGETWA